MERSKNIFTRRKTPEQPTLHVKHPKHGTNKNEATQLRASLDLESHRVLFSSIPETGWGELFDLVLLTAQ